MKGSLIDALVFQEMADTRVGAACDGLTMDQIEEAVIRYQLAKHGGNRRLTAEALGMSERTFARRIAELGMKKR